MPSLLLLAFVLQLVIHLVNTFGASTVNTVLWNLYSLLPTPGSKDAAEHKKLQREYLRVRKDLNATSSQDEFAKWAKLRRQHDKLLEELEKRSQSPSDKILTLVISRRRGADLTIEVALDRGKATFDQIVSTLRWLSTNGLRMFMQFWYSRQPMFWLPQGWIPYYAEWLISFPRAPLGSVSIQAWMLACASIILLISDALVAVIGLATKSSVKVEQKGEKVPMKFAGENTTKEKTSNEGKKEL